MKKENSGYREVAHTADWALEVWAPDLAGLMTEAARGMYALCQVEVTEEAAQRDEILVRGREPEGLLVEFLSELVYRMERDRLAFDVVRIAEEPQGLGVELAGRRIRGQTKEIKAVTYHDLQVESTEAGLRAVMVFDV